MTTTQTATSRLATPTLVIGIVAAVLAALSVLPLIGLLVAGLAFIAAITAIVLGRIAKPSDTTTKIGLILGYIGLSITVGWIVVRFVAASL